MIRNIADNDLSGGAMSLGRNFITRSLFKFFGWSMGFGLNVGGKKNFIIHEKVL